MASAAVASEMASAVRAADKIETCPIPPANGRIEEVDLREELRDHVVEGDREWERARRRRPEPVERDVRLEGRADVVCPRVGGDLPDAADPLWRRQSLERRGDREVRVDQVAFDRLREPSFERGGQLRQIPRHSALGERATLHALDVERALIAGR